ncbi:MAG TPA: hypothetical protein VGB61_14035 [Pyrinomonadaceae bacterium]
MSRLLNSAAISVSTPFFEERLRLTGVRFVTLRFHKGLAVFAAAPAAGALPRGAGPCLAGGAGDSAGGFAMGGFGCWAETAAGDANSNAPAKINTKR